LFIADNNIASSAFHQSLLFAVAARGAAGRVAAGVPLRLARLWRAWIRFCRFLEICAKVIVDNIALEIC
jgi:hypothetical protein